MANKPGQIVAMDNGSDIWYRPSSGSTVSPLPQLRLSSSGAINPRSEKVQQEVEQRRRQLAEFSR